MRTFTLPDGGNGWHNITVTMIDETDEDYGYTTLEYTNYDDQYMKINITDDQMRLFLKQIVG